MLILVGERDPVTPPRWGHEIARHLTNAVVAVVPDGGHGFGDLENAACVDRLRTAFVDAASPAIDLSCLAAVRRRPFITDTTGTPGTFPGRGR